ncbi:hypothetical protein [Phenylobacterium sp.]|uniref:hypothetical protein n=1 Tax=Phenylobacterium sp. TaxID=1871053 RepID=UPI00273249F8|nr:hypothetical protein [Phenylobacterium sp.]MDP3853137.1 hypothetical protein [Phenylobacterium sp.]
MKTMLCAGALALASVALSGCITEAGRAAFPNLKQIELRIQSNQNCGDVAAGVVAATDEGELSNKALVALFKACTAWQGGQTIILDPEAARKSMPGL